MNHIIPSKFSFHENDTDDEMELLFTTASKIKWNVSIGKNI